MYKVLIYLSVSCLTCFGLFGWVWCQRPGADTIRNDLNHYRICTPAFEDGLKESPKHVRQKQID
jgi:hypothetical protein